MHNIYTHVYGEPFHIYRYYTLGELPYTTKGYFLLDNDTKGYFYFQAHPRGLHWSVQIDCKSVII